MSAEHIVFLFHQEHTSARVYRLRGSRSGTVLAAWPHSQPVGGVRSQADAGAVAQTIQLGGCWDRVGDGIGTAHRAHAAHRGSCSPWGAHHG